MYTSKAVLTVAETEMIADSRITLGSPATLTATVALGGNGVYLWDLDHRDYDSSAAVTATDAFDEVITGLVATNDGPTALGNATTLTATITITTGIKVTYTWDFGDGDPGGTVVTHTYPSEGVYTAVVTHTYPRVEIYTATVTATNLANPVTATTTVTVRYCAYLPLVLKHSPCFDLPLNGDFSMSDNGFAANWDSEAAPPLHVDHVDGQIFIGYDQDERIGLPGMGMCVSAYLYQDFYLLSNCYDDPWLQFAYRLFSYDYDRPSSDAFLVYVDDLDGGPPYLIHADRSHQSSEDSKNGKVYDSGWMTSTVALPASLTDGPVRLRFEVRYCEPWPRTLAWWPTWIYLDNVIIMDQP